MAALSVDSAKNIAIVVVVAFVVLVVIMIKVIPAFKDIFKNFGDRSWFHGVHFTASREVLQATNDLRDALCCLLDFFHVFDRIKRVGKVTEPAV